MTDLPRIVFVDDDEDLLSGLRRALHNQRNVWQMEFINDPLSALERLRDGSANVAVLDINMPKMDGISLARELKGAAPRTRCLILSGSEDFSSVVQLLNEGGVFRYLLKPCDTAQLSEAIDEALADQSRHLPAQLQSSALGLLGIALIVLDGAGKVLFTSEKGGQILSDNRCLFVDPGGQCRASDKQSMQRLAQAMQAVQTEDRPQALSFLSSDGDEEMHALILSHLVGDRPQIFLFLSEREAFPEPDPELLSQMFGLSGSEARLAAALASGMSLEEASEHCQLTLSTARTYLKAIFQKTEVPRQAELVRKILLAFAGLPKTPSGPD